MGLWDPGGKRGRESRLVYEGTVLELGVTWGRDGGAGGEEEEEEVVGGRGLEPRAGLEPGEERGKGVDCRRDYMVTICGHIYGEYVETIWRLSGRVYRKD